MAAVVAACLAVQPALAADAGGAEPGPTAADYAATWGPATGTPAPAITALDQDGRERTLADLSGERGLLLVFFRSADW
jgi:hypothetical protein